MSVEEQDTSDKPDNVLKFGPGILPSDVAVTGYRHGVGGSTLTLNLRSDGSVDLENALNNRLGRTYGVQRIQFANGTVWTYADLLARAGLPPPNGGSRSERQPSLFLLKPGRSPFQGTGGGDNLGYERGIGVVTINEPGLSPHRPNRLAFGEGIAPGSVTPLRAGSADIYLDLGQDEGVLLSGERQASPPDDDAGIQIVTFADGTRWTKADLLRKAASDPLDQDKFAAQRRQRTEQARSAEAARADAAARAHVNAIYARFFADLHAGLDQIGLPADEADALLPVPMLRRYPDRPCRIAAETLMRRDAVTMSVWRRKIGTLADALDLKYGISDVGTAPDYMNPQGAITPISAMRMAVAALRDARPAPSPSSCYNHSR